MTCTDCGRETDDWGMIPKCDDCAERRAWKIFRMCWESVDTDLVEFAREMGEWA